MIPYLRAGLSLRAKLILMGLALFLVPWFSFRQFEQMESFLVQGQSRAQLLTAKGVAAVLNGREDLFNDLPISLDGYETLYAHPLTTAVRIDGRPQDWTALNDKKQHFGAAHNEQQVVDGSFDLMLGERGGQLYVFLEVNDNTLVWRNPNALRLDNADHVRLSYVTSRGLPGRLHIALQEPGVTTAYSMDPDWHFAQDGQPENRLQGFMMKTGTGYRVEFRIPLAMLGSRRSFGLSVADVDDPQQRTIRAIAQTLPTAGPESFNLVVLRSPEVLNIIRGLGYSGARILVVDPQQRVRAESGSYSSHPNQAESMDWISFLLDPLRALVRKLVANTRQELGEPQGISSSEEAIRTSLSGEPVTVLRRLANGEEIIMAAHPIVGSDASIIGTVAVEQNTDDILQLQRSALERIIMVSVIGLLIVFFTLLFFAMRLAWRIRSLGAETMNSIDQHGRLQTNQLRREINAGDELGDLARSVSNMLTKLHQHNRFVESLPRTLRHELNNPLNTLSTSLHNLENEHQDLSDNKYLEAARRGVMRIGTIVQSLADAANLEESFLTEELETLDIKELLENYFLNCTFARPECNFIFHSDVQHVYADVADYRIEQLLDKIIDNAVDFHTPGTPIHMQLDVKRSTLEITVTNKGSVLAPEIVSNLFDSMASIRTSSSPDERLHLGLGLYVVRVIAERHGGSARAANLPHERGVAITVSLPLAQQMLRVRTPA